MTTPALRSAIHWTDTADQAAESLQRRYADDIAAAPDKKRFVFAYTNEQVDTLNAFARDVHRERGVLGEDGDGAEGDTSLAQPFHVPDHRPLGLAPR